MNSVDEKYLGLARDIMENGTDKDTRAGRVRSVFGRHLRFNLKEGLPLLTTKKVFTNGAIHELLWFLQRPCNSHGSMNIEYLVRNGVHIWDADAYRWFKSDIVPKYKGKIENIFICTNDDETIHGRRAELQYWMENQARKDDQEWLESMDKEEFLDMVLQKAELHAKGEKPYRFGDLGPIYGKQWRRFGNSGTDQIQKIVDTLKTNPSDRRMICLAFNPDVLNDVALPPCHVMMQFYTRKLTQEERAEALKRLKTTDEKLPEYALSCMWTQRSCDYFLGGPVNMISYAILTHMIAKLVNMVPDELIASFGDCHIYEAHFDAISEQLGREGSDKLARLKIGGRQKTIDDFKFTDFKITGYEPDPVIKAPLLVGK